MNYKPPNKNAVPGLAEHLPQNVQLLGLENSVSFEYKLLLFDIKIIENVEKGAMDAVGRLVELREAVIQEKFNLTKDYIRAKRKVLVELEKEELEALRIDNVVKANRLKFEKFKRVFREQEKFLARNYPIRVLVREKIKWE